MIYGSIDASLPVFLPSEWSISGSVITWINKIMVRQRNWWTHSLFISSFDALWSESAILDHWSWVHIILKTPTPHKSGHFLMFYCPNHVETFCTKKVDPFEKLITFLKNRSALCTCVGFHSNLIFNLKPAPGMETPESTILNTWLKISFRCDQRYMYMFKK